MGLSTYAEQPAQRANFADAGLSCHIWAIQVEKQLQKQLKYDERQ